MEEFLTILGMQAMKYAIRSGIALTSTYAIGQCTRLLRSVENDKIYAELGCLQKQLDAKIQIITPAIDLVELKAGRGNIFLESAVPLVKGIQNDITSLGSRLEAAAKLEEANHEQTQLDKKPAESIEKLELSSAVTELKRFLSRLDGEIPLLQLAISASGESLTTSLPPSISPSRLLQASTLLTVGDTQHAQDPASAVQVGPSMMLSLYMLFLGHANTRHRPHSQDTCETTTGSSYEAAYGLGDNERKPLWQEVIHKAKLCLCRSACSRASAANKEVGQSNTGALREKVYAYYLEIVQDLDDGRAHDINGGLQGPPSVHEEPIRIKIPIAELSKIFYTDTGRMLNIGGEDNQENRPVLLLKRDLFSQSHDDRKTPEMNRQSQIANPEAKTAESAEASEQSEIDTQLRQECEQQAKSPSSFLGKAATVGSQGLPQHLDPEWIALEIFEADAEDPSSSDSDSAANSPFEKSGNEAWSPAGQTGTTAGVSLESQIRALSLRQDLGYPEQGGSSTRRPPRIPASAEAVEADFVARSPFGSITTSLSLLEMLIRLASLQEFQQASHLSIPDHIMTFFLEETSTTGLVGEAQWKARSEAKRRVGFDPYTDMSVPQVGGGAEAAQ